MKKYEFIGLILAIFIILVTYLFNYFYTEINYMIHPKYVSAQVNENTTNERDKENTSAFNPLIVTTSKENYYRYELIDIYADYKDLNGETITTGEIEAKIYKENKVISTIGSIEKIYLRYNPKLNLWVGKWPIPYNPPLGKYDVLIRTMPTNPGPVITAVANFNIVGREVKKSDHSLCAMLLEHGGNITYKKGIFGPDDTEGDWRNIIKWAKYTGANAFFMLGAESATYNNNISKKRPFDPEKLRAVEIVGAEVKKHDLLFGAWTMTFGFQGKDCSKLGYKPSLGYSPDSNLLYPSYMHISLIDEKRFNDLINVVKEFDKNPNIDYIGFDYVRTGHADGYEMADLVVRDMSISVPNNWEDMNDKEQQIWFARKIKVDRDEDIVAKWEWWRAHKIAEILNKIITLSGTKKPIWTFTLGWEHGKQHGQDPIMMMDAGVSIDAVMLYEANQKQFRQVLVDWKGYVASSQVNIIVGQTVDVNLLDSESLIPPDEFVQRITLGTKKIVFGGLTDGLFWHDVSRALWGRKGSYPAKEWFLTAGKSFSMYRAERGEVSLKLDINIRNKDYGNREFFIDTIVENQTINLVSGIKINLLDTEGIIPLGNKNITINNLSPGESKLLTFQVKVNNNLKARNKFMVAVVAETSHSYNVINFQYLSPSKIYSRVTN